MRTAQTDFQHMCIGGASDEIVASVNGFMGTISLGWLPGEDIIVYSYDLGKLGTCAK